MHRGRIVLADNLAVLADTPDDHIDLIYVDPPFNTGQRQTLERLKTVRDEADGDRAGFQGRRYRTLKLGASSYEDIFDDYLAFLEPRLREFRRVLKPTGSLYVHLDYREVHYRADPVHGARSGRPRESRPRQAADRRLVAHHRAHRGQGAHGLPDAEAARDPAPNRHDVVTTRWAGCRLLCRQRDYGDGRVRSRPTILAGRLQS